jgi:ribosomal protein S18 acetylase RimI-like enzyme
MPTFWIRPYEPRDLEAVYDICLRTGDAGEDATHLYRDPKVLGHVYTAPYVVLEPELAFVLEDKAGVCGYVIGAVDTAGFQERYEDEWLPCIRQNYQAPGGDPANFTQEERLVHSFFYPNTSLPPFIDDYPSHLHIDLLPRAQGHGQGRRLMETLLKTLKAKGSPGVHLGMGIRNERAYGFYQALGFTELSRSEHGIAFGMKLS